MTCNHCHLLIGWSGLLYHAMAPLLLFLLFRAQGVTAPWKSQTACPSCKWMTALFMVSLHYVHRPMLACVVAAQQNMDKTV